MGSDLEAYILPNGDAAKNASGRQEMLGNLINDFI
jgi:xylose isomerase